MATWTPEEDKILTELYETAPREKILAELPNRVWKSIYKRSVILNLKRPKDDAWKKEDDDRLRELYPNTPWDILLTHFPDRTKKSLAWRAINILRLTRDPEIVQEETRKTNLARRGVEYPTQSAVVWNKVEAKVRERYGVDNVFQAEEIKKKSKETNLKKFGTEYPNQNKGVREKTRQTNQERHGVDNTFQLRDKIRSGMVNKYGIDHPQRVPEIRDKTVQTNMGKYGFPTPAQNPEVRKKLIEKLNSPEIREKAYKSLKERDNFHQSQEEINFFNYLKKIDPETVSHKLHPIIYHVIDYYMPSFDMWVQYDGVYWHGKLKKEGYIQTQNIQEGMSRDAYENELIPNLIRFWSDDVLKGIKEGTIEDIIKGSLEDKLQENKDLPQSCSQFKKRILYFEEDINSLPFNPSKLSAIDFELNIESLSDEIIGFIEKYEWLGTIGVHPKWCFTARYNRILGGAVLINEPTAYSKILGEETPKYEALIQRGASASWTPKNLGSRLIMFSCKWMVKNTSKRVFVGYADPNANERGVIYRACNFDYLGDDFGTSELFKHPSINRLFTKQYLNRTSTLKVWCRENNIRMEKIWFKENGFKNLETIPAEIKKAWYEWGNKIINESEKIKVEKKRKFAIVLGTNKRETKYLKSLKIYKSLDFPKENRLSKQIPIRVSVGKTRSRRNNVKDQFIIDNYGKITRMEIVKALEESPRWVKRAIKRLFNENKITRK